MSNLNAVLEKAIIRKIDVDISKEIENSFELKAECKARILPPKEKIIRS